VSRYRLIAAQKAQHSVVRLCRALRVSTSGFYAWQRRTPSPRAQANLQLTEQIRSIHTRSQATYGRPRVQAELRAQGHCVNHKRVARLMRRAGLVGHTPRRFRSTTLADPQRRREDLVRRQFSAQGPNQLWVSDITYVRTWAGWLYLAVILDVYSRRVVGWSLGEQMKADLAISALQMAVQTRRPAAGLIHHSDRGSQYTSSAYGELLRKYGARQSLGQPGTAYDNAVAESFFATLKREVVYRHPWPTRQAARSAIFSFLEGWYNRQRRHSALGYLSPNAFEELHSSAPTDQIA
jgi:putative transposase